MNTTLKNASQTGAQLCPEELIAKKIYEKCVELKLSKFKTKAEQQALMAIGANMGLNLDLKTMKLLYLGGQQIAEEVQTGQKVTTVAEAHEREQKIFDAQVAKAAFIGKDKYLAKTPAVSNGKNKLNLPYSTRGFMRTSEMEITNACIVAEAADKRRYARDVAEIVHGGEAVVERKRAAIAAERGGSFATKAALREYIDSRLVDTSYAFEAEVFPTVQNLRCMVTKGRNFVVQGEISCSDVVSLFGKKAVLDGAFRISVADETGALVAEGVFSAPGIGNAELTEVGFVNGYTFQVLCVSDEPLKIHPNGFYTCVATPIAVWAIEL